MLNKILKFLALGGIILLCSQYLEGVKVTGGYQYALIAAVVLSLANTFIRPILSILSFPITLVTFGLFSLVITALMVMLMDHLVDHVQVASFWWALALGIIVSLSSSILDKVIPASRKKIVKPLQKKEEFTSYTEVK